MNLLDGHLKSVALLADREMAEIYVKALAYYDGVQPSGMLKVKEDRIDDNVSTNYAATIVDKGVSFLFGSDLRIEVKGNDAAQKTLEEIWPLDCRSCDLANAATNGGIFGHAWLKITVESNKPEIHVLDPMNMSVKLDRTNYKRVERYRNQFNTLDENDKPIIWREDTIRIGDRWEIVESWSKPDMTTWIEVSRTVWPYSFPPVIECQNIPKPNEFYGRPDLSKSVLSLIFYLARTDSLINKIIRAHASPKPIARGVKKQDLQIGTDEMLFLPDKEQEIKLLEMTGDLAGAMAFRKQLRESLSEISHVPEIASGKLDGVGTLSGLALKILYGPLVDRTITKRRLYGKLVKDSVRAVLAISGVTNPEIELHWSSVTPVDELEQLDAASRKQALGVSTDTVLSELGYDAQIERRKWETERPTEQPNNRSGNPSGETDEQQS